MVPEISTMDLAFINKDGETQMDYPRSGGKCKRGKLGVGWRNDLGKQRRAMFYLKKETAAHLQPVFTTWEYGVQGCQVV